MDALEAAQVADIMRQFNAARRLLQWTFGADRADRLLSEEVARERAETEANRQTGDGAPGRSA